MALPGNIVVGAFGMMEYWLRYDGCVLLVKGLWAVKREKFVFT
jgi:hypothetical protein